MGTMSLRATIAAPVVATAATVSGLGLAVELVHTRSHADVVERLVGFLSLSYEQNLPTWYASSLLLVCALLLVAIGRDARRRDRRFAIAWFALGTGFAVMSLDEASELHEQLYGVVDGGDLVYFDWIIPAGAAVLLLAIAFVPFLRTLPSRRRRDFVVAGALYLGGAVVMELPLGWWTAAHGTDSAGYALIDWIEESMELAGASWFLLALAARWDERAEASP
jgi:hypothetical protein